MEVVHPTPANTRLRRSILGEPVSTIRRELRRRLPKAQRRRLVLARKRVSAVVQPTASFASVVARGAWRPKPHAPVFVIADGRSGSTLLMEYLSQLHGVTCIAYPGEPLHPDLLHASASRRAALMSLRCQLAVLESQSPCAKLTLRQLESHSIEAAHLRTEYPGARVIMLARESLVGQFISRRRAVETGEWHKRAGIEKHRSGDWKLRLDANEFTQEATYIRKLYRDFGRDPWIADRALRVTYESLVESPQGVFDQLADHLGVPRSRVRTPHLRRVIDRPLHELLSNPEVLDALTGAQFEWSELEGPFNEDATR